MYDEILGGIKGKCSLISGVELAAHLRSLREYTRDLRKAHRKFPVYCNYADVHVQQAYMLAYYPHYTQLLEYALNRVRYELNNRLLLNLLLIGSGPCPEIIGYLNFLNSFRKKVSLNVSIFDAVDWEFSRDITFNYIVPNYLKDQSISNWNFKNLAINQPFKASTAFDNVDLSQPQLVVCQNCLSEIKLADHSTVISNFRKLYKSLPSSSIIAIIESSTNLHVSDFLASIQANLASEYRSKILKDTKIGHEEITSSYRGTPPVIENNLLTGTQFEAEHDLIPRSRTKFIFSLIKKE